MGEATVVVTCQACGKELEEPPGLEQRPPCLNCGSTTRHVMVGVDDTIAIHASVAVKARHGDRGRPFREIKQGDDLHQKTGRWNILSRLIDREQDSYEERIVDGQTGEVIREVREPLSKHRGRGSVKRPRPK